MSDPAIPNPLPPGSPTTSSVNPASGLPPVAPPSGRDLIKMFLVPGMIVGLLVVAWLFAHWFFSSPSSGKILRDLDDANPEVRWRAAEQLAQVLPRDTTLASNVPFALEITSRLQRSVAENRAAEKVRKEQLEAVKGTASPAAKTLQHERDLVQFLIACVGKFVVPVGAPLLQELALDDYGSDPEVAFRRRAQAVMSLGDMGSQLARFDGLPSERRTQVLADLGSASAEGGDRGRWASEAQQFLTARQEGRSAPASSVSETLRKTAKASAPFLRKVSAVALGYWDGPGVDDTLLELTRDDGRGANPVKFDAEQEKYFEDHPEELRQQNRKDIAANAALALARRGSPRAAELTDLYAELLDEQKQRDRFSVGPASEKTAAEARSVDAIVLTLSRLQALHRVRPEIALPREAIEKLTTSSNKRIRAAALELWNALKK